MTAASGAIAKCQQQKYLLYMYTRIHISNVRALEGILQKYIHMLRISFAFSLSFSCVTAFYCYAVYISMHLPQVF